MTIAVVIARWKIDWTKFAALDGVDKRLLLRAAALLFVARIKLSVMPFSRLSAQQFVESGAPQPDYNPDLLQRMSRAVAIAANHVPWRSDCFPQAIAARTLLKRHGYSSTIHIGVEREGDDILNGHAWLTCGETVITGGGELHRYTELYGPSA